MFPVPGLLQYTRMPGELMSPTVATIPTISHYERHHRPSSNPKSNKPNFQFPSLQSSPRTYYYNYWTSVISLDIILQLLNFSHLLGHTTTTTELQSSSGTYYYNFSTTDYQYFIPTTTVVLRSSPRTYFYNYWPLVLDIHKDIPLHWHSVIDNYWSILYFNNYGPIGLNIYFSTIDPHSFATTFILLQL